LEKKKIDNDKRIRVYDLNEAKYKRIEKDNKHQIKVADEEREK
jgi:hypothetical protein